MIQANELRIGNWVNYGEGSNPFLIATSGIFSNLLKGKMVNIQTCNPIPLTEEWLLKFGFEKWPDNEQFQNYVLPNDKNFGINTPHFSGKKYIKGEFYYSPTDREIKTVHQLQNLYFSLTGEELIINRAASIADSANINASLMPGNYANREHHGKV